MQLFEVSQCNVLPLLTVTECHYYKSMLHQARMRWWHVIGTRCEVLFIDLAVRSCLVFVTVRCRWSLLLLEYGATIHTV